MTEQRHILAIDQGTTSSRAMVFDADGHALFTAQREFRQIFPRDGWVEHDPEEIWSTTLAVCREAKEASVAAAGRVVAIGITNQRETTVVWDRSTGKPVYNAIVWQDRRTAEHCARLKGEGHESMVSRRTGLLLDPYFSGTKAAWILDNVDGARARANRGELAFGTIDTFLLWRLTSGAVHLTDATNASRTLLYNIHDNAWDADLLELLDVPESLLPGVEDCAAEFGFTDPALLGESIAIAGIAGDQQAATVGQACFEPGMIKSTYGTGCFVLLNTGEKPVASRNRLLTTIAYRVSGQTCYAIEGSIFMAGAAVQWLRDGIGLISSAGETEAIAASQDSNKGVYLVPAFTGLGAPYWDPEARGAIFGMSRDTGRNEIVRATLESVCYQTSDLFRAMADDGVAPKQLRVDGGMVQNGWMTQYLADVLGIPVERPAETETTALGAAFLAGLQVGVFGSFEDLRARWRCERRFEPAMASSERERVLADWERVVSRVQMR